MSRLNVSFLYLITNLKHLSNLNKVQIYFAKCDIILLEIPFMIISISAVVEIFNKKHTNNNNKYYKTYELEYKL